MSGAAVGSRGASPAARVAASVMLGVCLLVFLAIGAAWVNDRTRDWEEPRWDPSRFTALSGGAAERRAPPAPAESWVVAVNPDCGHCAQSLRDAALVRSRRGDATALHALIVDQATRPPRDVLRGHDVESVWWDDRGVWRTRWGHRVYGEVLRFDAAGRWLETWPPERVARDVPDP